MPTPNPEMSFEEAVAGLLAGDFTRLDLLFQTTRNDGSSLIQEWHEQGRFEGKAEALKEALTCACFNGRIEAAEYLIKQGVDVSGGIATGLNAFHWAANRGQLDAVRLLLRHNAHLETLNSYGGTVLSCAVWSAIHEPKPMHLSIIEELIHAGARTDMLETPTGHPAVDKLLGRYRHQR